jgi:uncharacterized iron-regulated protein
MYKIFIFLLGAQLLLAPSLAQQAIYEIYETSSGRKIDVQELAKKVSSAQVILFGESHNNAVAHWLQLQLLKNLAKDNPTMALSGEFFESDDQLNIDEWMKGFLTDKNFEAEAKLWTNYLIDYKPLMLFAKENQIPFVASNVPRKYASLVSRKGLDELSRLSDEAKTFLPPLPIVVDNSLPSYQAMKEMMHGAQNSDFMVEAQALKDATMANSILLALKNHSLIYHINGSYHSNHREGIVWYLKKSNSNLRIVTLSTLEQNYKDVKEVLQPNLADFVIVLPIDAPKSYE